MRLFGSGKRNIAVRMPDRISTLVMFGATGDLARRMLLPSLYGLDSDGLLPADLRIVGTARSDLDDSGFRGQAEQALKDHLPKGFFQLGVAERFLSRLHYVALDINEPDAVTVRAALIEEGIFPRSRARSR